jgi:hypothetical protein
MRESTPVILRAIGTFAILAFTVGSFFAVQNAAEIARSSAGMPFRPIKTSTPWNSLSEQGKKERAYQNILNDIARGVADIHYDMERRSLAGVISSSPTLTSVGFIGTGFIFIAFFIEWTIKSRKEDAEERAARLRDLPPSPL